MKTLKTILKGSLLGLLFLSGTASASTTACKEANTNLACPCGYTTYHNQTSYASGYAYGAASASAGFAAADSDALYNLAVDIADLQDACEMAADEDPFIFDYTNMVRSNPDATSACIGFGGTWDCNQTVQRDVICCIAN